MNSGPVLALPAHKEQLKAGQIEIINLQVIIGVPTIEGIASGKRSI